MTDSDQIRVDRLVDELLEKHPPATSKPEDIWGAQYDLGLAWVWHDLGFGGLGLDRRYQSNVNQRSKPLAPRRRTGSPTF